MTNQEKRIKLAEAMGWKWIFGHGTGGYWLVGGMKKEWTAVEHRHFQCPNPFTDANDDYAVLQWAANNLDGAQFDIFRQAYRDLHDGSLSAMLYRIGDYARAALKVLV